MTVWSSGCRLRMCFWMPIRKLCQVAWKGSLAQLGSPAGGEGTACSWRPHKR